MIGTEFTTIEADSSLGIGYKASYERNPLTNENYDSCEFYIQQRLRLNHHNLDWNLQKQRRFGIYITGIPIKLYNEVEETHLCSVREDWFMHGCKIFSTPYAREITIETSFRGGEYLSFSDDPKIVISSRTELGDFNGYKYKTFRVSDPHGLCPDLKSGAFRNFPEYNKEIFKQVFALLKKVRGSSIDVVNMVEILARCETSEIRKNPHHQYCAPNLDFSALEEWRSYKKQVTASAVKTGIIF